MSENAETLDSSIDASIDVPLTSEDKEDVPTVAHDGGDAVLTPFKQHHFSVRERAQSINTPSEKDNSSLTSSPAPLSYTIDETSTNPCKVETCECTGMEAHQWKKDHCRHCNHPSSAHTVHRETTSSPSSGPAPSKVVLSWLVSHGNDVARYDAVTGNSMLHLASAEEDPSVRRTIVEQLLKRMIEVNHRNINGESALHVAAGLGCSAVSKMLLDVNADPKFKTYRDGRTALHYACDAACNNRGDESTLSVFIDHDVKYNNGALISEPDSSGWTPLALIAKGDGPSFAKDILLKNGANASDAEPESIERIKDLAIEAEKNAVEREVSERAKALEQLVADKAEAERNAKELKERLALASLEKKRRDEEAATEERKKRRAREEEFKRLREKEKADKELALKAAREKMEEDDRLQELTLREELERKLSSSVTKKSNEELPIINNQSSEQLSTETAQELNAHDSPVSGEPVIETIVDEIENMPKEQNIANQPEDIEGKIPADSVIVVSSKSEQPESTLKISAENLSDHSTKTISQDKSKSVSESDAVDKDPPLPGSSGLVVLPPVVGDRVWSQVVVSNTKAKSQPLLKSAHPKSISAASAPLSSTSVTEKKNVFAVAASISPHTNDQKTKSAPVVSKLPRVGSKSPSHGAKSNYKKSPMLQPSGKVTSPYRIPESKRNNPPIVSLGEAHKSAFSHESEKRKPVTDDEWHTISGATKTVLVESSILDNAKAANKLTVEKDPTKSTPLIGSNKLVNSGKSNEKFSSKSNEKKSMTKPEDATNVAKAPAPAASKSSSSTAIKALGVAATKSSSAAPPAVSLKPSAPSVIKNLSTETSLKSSKAKSKVSGKAGQQSARSDLKWTPYLVSIVSGIIYFSILYVSLAIFCGIFGISVGAIIGGTLPTISSGGVVIRGSSGLLVRGGPTVGCNNNIFATGGSRDISSGKVTPESGSVKIYSSSGALLSTLKSMEGDDLFGTSIAVDEETVAIGASTAHRRIGGVYVATRKDSNVFSLGNIMVPQHIVSGDRGGKFGESVALHQGTLVAGGPDWTPAGSVTPHGAVAVWTRSSKGLWLSSPMLRGHSSGDMFGSCVAIAGSTLVVGAPGNNNNHGAAYIYFVESGNVTLTKTIESMPEIGESGSKSFASNGRCAISSAGDIIVLSSPSLRPNGDGVVFVYERVLGIWTMVIDIVSISGRNGANNGCGFSDRFGSSVAAAGDFIIVSASHACLPDGSRAGEVDVFNRETSGSWKKVTTLRSPKPERTPEFGTNVSLHFSGGVYSAVISSHDSNTDGADSFLTTWSTVSQLVTLSQSSN